VVHPELLSEIEGDVGDLSFVDPAVENLRQEIISWYSETGDLDQSPLKNHLCNVGFAALVEQLTAAGPATVWYSAADLADGDVLEAWRSRVAQYRRLESRRMSRNALADAISAAREDEVRVQGLTIDRLFNNRENKKVRGGR
jgi:hypothetical protein